MVKCINCKFLDMGFSVNDSFPHCGIKHALDIGRGISRRQPEITREEAYKERECEHFGYEEKEDPEDVFKLTPEGIEEGREIAIQFQKELERELSKRGIKCKS